MRFRPQSALEPETVEALLDLRRRLDDLSPSDLQSGIVDLLPALAETVNAQPSFLVVAKRSGNSTADPLLGWRPVKMVFAKSIDSDVEKASEAQPDMYMNDPLVRYVVSTAGSPRVYRDRALHEQHGWGETQTLKLLKQAGISDRMVGVQPIGEHTEVYVSVDCVDRECFSSAEADVYLAAISMMGRPLRDFTRLYGPLDTGTELSRREHDTLVHLLSGHSERDIAKSMGISAGTLHGYVVQVYRKFGVSSRPQLMSMWTDGGTAG